MKDLRWWKRREGQPDWQESSLRVSEQVPRDGRLRRVQARLNVLAVGLFLAALVWIWLWAVLFMRSPGQMVERGELSQAMTQPVRLAQALVLDRDGPAFPGEEGAMSVRMPDDWVARKQGAGGVSWYRFHLDPLARLTQPPPLMAALIERPCSTVLVQFNGHVLYRAGSFDRPLVRQCLQSHLVPIPASLMVEGDNHLDVRVQGRPRAEVTVRQRAGGLGGVQVGPWETMVERHRQQDFWAFTGSQIAAGVLAVLAVFAMGLGWIRSVSYLIHFGWLLLSWALLTSRFWLVSLNLSYHWSEVVLGSLFGPVTVFTVLFLLDFLGHGGRMPHRLRRHIPNVGRFLHVQMLVMPLTLAVSGPYLAQVMLVWLPLLVVQFSLAVLLLLWMSTRVRRPEFWLMSGAMGCATAMVVLELAYQNDAVPGVGVNVTYFILPLMFAAVAYRLMQVYARAMKTGEGARIHLEQRVKEVTAEIEANFAQIAELRAEQVAERERRRIAGDLHDDLGAKLLTIVHTADNDRISSLARDALEEMRLSVRGLTGKAKRLPDALADWRSEVVMRLGQAGIEVEWRHPSGELDDEPLSARTYVQTTRIIREAVSNIIKHSEASHVVVGCEVLPAEFEIVIQDNGRGIPAGPDDRLDRGHGMDSMKHRARQLNGRCEVESGAGFGTVIRLTLPLESETVALARTAGATSPPGRAGAASMPMSSGGSFPS